MSTATTATSTARKNAAADKANTTAPAAESLRVNLHILIDLNPAKWSFDAPAETDEATTPEAVKAALVAGGIAAELADEMVAKMTAAKPASETGVSAVRESLREYVIGELRKLEKLTAAAATVAFYERPAK